MSSKKDKPVIRKKSTLHGKTVRKSGAVRYTMQGPKPKNTVEHDYKNLEYKRYSSEIYIHREMQGKSFPPDSQVPPYKKYDDKGNYIKDKFIATKKQAKPKNGAKYSISGLTRESDSTNPKRNSSVKKGK